MSYFLCHCSIIDHGKGGVWEARCGFAHWAFRQDPIPIGWKYTLGPNGIISNADTWPNSLRIFVVGIYGNRIACCANRCCCRGLDLNWVNSMPRDSWRFLVFEFQQGNIDAGNEWLRGLLMVWSQAEESQAGWTLWKWEGLCFTRCTQRQLKVGFFPWSSHNIWNVHL